jgi:hypothetical protein
MEETLVSRQHCQGAVGGGRRVTVAVKDPRLGRHLDSCCVLYQTPVARVPWATASRPAARTDVLGFEAIVSAS